MKMIWAFTAAAVLLAALTMALRGYPDWSLRKSYPMYTSLLIATGFNVPANSEFQILNITGKGQVDGISFRFTDVDVLACVEIRFYIDGAASPQSIFLLTPLIPFFSPAGVNAGRPGSPFTVTLYDAANKYYGFSITAPIRFTKSLRITVYNYHAKTIGGDVIGFVSLEG